MKKEPILYGIMGLLVGIVLASFIATYAVNNNNTGMMNMMGMDNNRMLSGNIDRRFIEQMIPHHDSAIVMAKLAQQKSTRPEIKKLADNIISSQTAEIKSMRQWYKDWYGTDVSTSNSTGMHGDSIMSSQSGIVSLSSATDFDQAFLSQMIVHHQMAVMMASMLDIGTNRAEMQKLSKDIYAAQTKEINDMKTWQQQWGYKSSSDTSNGMMNMMGR